MIHIQEKKFLILIGGVVLIFILIGGLIIYPQYRQIKETNGQITSLREQLETKYERAKQYHKSQTNLASAKKLTEAVNRNFIKKGEEIKLITILEEKAESYGLKQELNLNSNYNKLANKLSTIGLEITISGNYKDALAYLGFLQRNTFYLSIDQVTITKNTPPTLTPEKSKPAPAPQTLVTFNLKTAVYVQD